jgi:hypothetical protein
MISSHRNAMKSKKNYSVKIMHIFYPLRLTVFSAANSSCYSTISLDGILQETKINEADNSGGSPGPFLFS